MESVLSILDAPIFFQPKVPIADLMDNLKTLETKGIDFIAAKEEILNNPVYAELIISPSGNTTALQVTINENPQYRSLIRKRYELLDLTKLSSIQKNELREINQQISKINDDEAEQRADLIYQIREILLENSDQGTLFLGGASMIATDMMSFIKSDLAIFGIGVAIIFCLMLYIFFQNIWFVILPLSNALITTAFTASVLGLMDWKISVISSNFIALLLILTISLTVHVLVRFTEVSREADSVDEAILNTINQMVMPCLFAALTTAIAFLSLIMGDIKPVIEFGKMMAVGMAFAFAFTFTFAFVFALGLLISLSLTAESSFLTAGLGLVDSEEGSFLGSFAALLIGFFFGAMIFSAG